MSNFLLLPIVLVEIRKISAYWRSSRKISLISVASADNRPEGTLKGKAKENNGKKLFKNQLT